MSDRAREAPAIVRETMEDRPILADSAGHPVREGALPDGTPVWVHTTPIRDCPAVLILRELSSLPPFDDFHMAWRDRGRELPHEKEGGEG